MFSLDIKKLISSKMVYVINARTTTIIIFFFANLHSSWVMHTLHCAPCAMLRNVPLRTMEKFWLCKRCLAVSRLLHNLVDCMVVILRFSVVQTLYCLQSSLQIILSCPAQGNKHNACQNVKDISFQWGIDSLFAIFSIVTALEMWLL